MKKNFSHYFLISSLMVTMQSSFGTLTSQQKSDRNLSLTSHLEPAVVWRHFNAISQIPRGSFNEEAVAAYIMNVAKKHHCLATKDSVGNVIVQKGASSPLYADAPTVVIQSHMDMVCEKNKGVEHDFERDPITFVLNGNMLYADGTTLGADNGLGVAASLAIMEAENLVHGPLEFLFTVVEEAGFDGARNITPETFKGRMLINVDAEEDGSVYIGCAGSSYTVGTLPIERETLPHDYRFYSITIDKLKGGHSGVDIDKHRVNALCVVTQLLDYVDTIPYRLVSINGGNKLNAIARDAELVLAVPVEHETLFNWLVDGGMRVIYAMHKDREPHLTITKTALGTPCEAMRMTDQEKMVRLLRTMPHGVITMSPVIENLVETSTNFARITTTANAVTLETMQRSLVSCGLDAIAQHILAIMQGVGGLACSTEGRTPEWQPNEHSSLLKMACSAYKRLTGSDLHVKAIHAGLECGAFAKQVPGLDAISFGPTIIDAHSPNEHVETDTVKPFWHFLTTLLATIAQQ